MGEAITFVVEQKDAFALLGLTLAACGVVLTMIARAPRELRMPLAVFNGFYLGTTVVGATLLANPAVRLFWMLMLPGMNASWLDVWSRPLYWMLLWAPIVIVNGTALIVGRHARGVTGFAQRSFSARVDPVSYLIVGLLMLGYCYSNLAIHGLFGSELLDAALSRDYRANIQLRTSMAAALGDTHYGFVYMGIPAICVLALVDAVRSGRRVAWAAFLGLSSLLSILYAATLTKGNIVVFGLAVVMAAVVTGLIRAKGIAVAVLAGFIVLTLMGGVLSGGGLFEVARSFLNIVFRMASGVPFYVAIFPSQVPYVGLDLGLGVLGFGPQNAANLIVANLMFPADTWVQGAIPAPAHIAAFAQGGVWWSLATMIMVGVLIAVVGKLLEGARSELGLAISVGGCVAVYNTTQTELIGVFLHSYGLKWWVGALAGAFFVQSLLEYSIASNGSE